MLYSMAKREVEHRANITLELARNKAELDRALEANRFFKKKLSCEKSKESRVCGESLLEKLSLEIERLKNACEFEKKNFDLREKEAYARGYADRSAEVRKLLSENV
jgi:hypothetical protein